MAGKGAKMMRILGDHCHRSAAEHQCTLLVHNPILAVSCRQTHRSPLSYTLAAETMCIMFYYLISFDII